jgi:hypothetical protein
MIKAFALKAIPRGLMMSSVMIIDVILTYYNNHQLMAAKSTSNLAKALTRNELNMLNLVHSALDLSPKLYNFA